VVNILETYHMISVEDMIASYDVCMIFGKPQSVDHFEKNDLIISCSLV